MEDSIILLMGSSLLIMVIGIGWVMARRYTPRLSQIDEELSTINFMLSEMPKEKSLQEYMFSQDQRLRSIGEKLDTNTDPALLQQYIQEHTQQLETITSMLAAGSKSELTKADLENALRVTNDSLEKVLWSLRFDEDRYTERTTENVKTFAEPSKEMVNSINKARDARDDDKSMQAILNNSDDDYSAMLKYMQKTGKGGTYALDALNNTESCRSR